jgi:transcriptional regulator with XRE-family HTH domain
MQEPSPLRRAREQRRLTQEQVADELCQLGLQHGHGELGVDANAVSRHERGVIAMPRAPYPELYARLYRVPIKVLWPLGRMEDMDRRTFLEAVAAASGAALLAGDEQDLDAMLTVTSGFRRLEATTPSGELREPVLHHLRLITNRSGRRYAAAAAEAAGLGAWLAWDQMDHAGAQRLYSRAVAHAEQAGSDALAAYMIGSKASWSATSGNGAEALGLLREVGDRMVGSGRAWWSATAATVHASAKDADATFYSLRQAEDALEAEYEPTWPFIYRFTPKKLQGYVGACHARLGLRKAAAPALREAMDGMGPTKQRAILLADLAIVVGGDEAEELRREARSIGERHQSRRVLAGV